MIEILLAVAAAHAEHQARRRHDANLISTRGERLRFAALLAVLLIVLGLVEWLGPR